MRLNLRVKIILFLAMVLILIMFIVVAKINNNDNLMSDVSEKIEANVSDSSKEKTETKTDDKEEIDSEAETTNSADVDSEESVSTYTDEELKELYTVFDNSLFIGDSRTEGIKIYSGITNADFFCEKSLDVERILSGETVNFNGKEQKLSEALTNKLYSKIYVCLGLNELGWKEQDEFIEKYQQIIDEVKEAQTSANIYVELVFPVNEEKTKESNTDKEYLNNENIRKINGKLISLAKRNSIKYLNPSKALVDENGDLKEDATNDGIHVNSTYAKQWAGYLAKITN